MIAHETIEAVKSRVAVGEIVGETVQLKQRGSSLIGLCPFHSEKSPSFHVRESYYHCFGCGVSGNVISFVMETQGLNFPDAVTLLAERAGIEVKRTGKSESIGQARDTKVLYEIMDQALSYYQLLLKKSDSVVIEYIKKRGLTKQTIKDFGVGFVPIGWRGLTEHLTKKKYDIELLIKSGLVKRGTSGEPYDTFRGRLIFPVHISGSKIAGFGGRVIPALYSEEELATAPKYLNSPETLIYEKKRILYGLPQAFAAIRASRTVYVVEGYMDVIGFAQVGIRNVVATCGTALTADHVKRLSGLARRVVIVFDADSAGKQAAGRAFELFLNVGVDVSAIFLPEGEDPDSLAASYREKTQPFLESLERRTLLSCRMENYLRDYAALSFATIGAVAKGKVAAELSGLFTRVDNAVERGELVRQAAAKLGVSEQSFESLANPQENLRLPTSAKTVEVVGPGAEAAVDILPHLDRQILCAVMVNRHSLPGAVLSDAILCEGLHPATLRFIFGLEEILSQADKSEPQQKEEILALLKVFGPSWLEQWRKAYDMARDKEVDLNLLFEQCRESVVRIKLKKNRDLIMVQIRDEGTLEEAERMQLFNDQLSLEQRSRGVPQVSK